MADLYFQTDTFKFWAAMHQFWCGWYEWTETRGEREPGELATVRDTLLVAWANAIGFASKGE